MQDMFDVLQRLFRKGLTYGTIIDVGSADGSFSVELVRRQIAGKGKLLNIDANRLYEDSLKKIASLLGGHYRIAAATDHDGEIELTMSAHPYWSSLRPAGDPYWQRVNGLSAEKVTVPALTLDRLALDLSLGGPYLIKLDVQGAEESALRGAARLLADTHVVVCEADVDDFDSIHRMLTDAGLGLYDAVHLGRDPEGALGWFYPIYVRRSLGFVRPQAFWREKDNAAAIAEQVQRRSLVLEHNASVLRQFERPGMSAEVPDEKLTRNALCSCGSGKKYKHCCGAHA